MKTIKKRMGSLVLMLIQPFLPFVIFITILLVIVGYLVDVLDWKINNEDEELLKEELSYYQEGVIFEDVKAFVKSAWDFITNALSSLKWPVKGYTTITSKFGYRQAPTTGASTYHGGIDIAAPERCRANSIY